MALSLLLVEHLCLVRNLLINMIILGDVTDAGLVVPHIVPDELVDIFERAVLFRAAVLIELLRQIRVQLLDAQLVLLLQLRHHQLVVFASAEKHIA